MSLLDISQVTQSLITLIKGAFDMSPGWSGNHPSVFPVPPIRIPDDGIGIYLYHITEDTHYKNLQAPGLDRPPVRFTPMGLNMYYQLSAHSTTDDGSGAFLEQRMMGVAMKGLHDYPEISDNTTVEINNTEVDVLPLILQGSDNRFRIVLQPQPPGEAVNFWTAGESPLKLSAYYQVSVVILEPEESRTRAGRVLAYSVPTFVEGAPKIIASQNVISFTIPGETEAAEVTLRPAQVPPGNPVSFSGTGFEGEDVRLHLNYRDWDEAGVAGPAWSVMTGGDEVKAIVQETIDLPLAGTTADILPGVYAAQIVVTRTRTLANGESRSFEHSSNLCPFMISPRVDSIGPIAADNTFEVTGYIFQHADLSTEDLRVYVAENLLESGTVPLNPGEFTVIDSTHLQVRLPDGLTTGQDLPFRIFVNNSESPPEWIRVP